MVIWKYSILVIHQIKLISLQTASLENLTIDTKFGDMCLMAITREESEHYTGIYINIMLAVITGFSVLLFAIFLIVAAHNISTEMEIDYKNLGIYKSQGFTDRTIR